MTIIQGVSNKKEVKTFLLVFAFIHVGILAYYFAWPVWDTQYNRIVSTGQTAYNVYSFIWWFIFVFIIFNIILVSLLFAVLADSKQKSRADLHFIFTIITLVINSLFVVLCVIYYFFFINKSYTGNLPFNDPRWCCYYFTSNADQCYNNAPCPFTPDLMPNYEFILHWIFAGVFTAITLLHLGINRLFVMARIVREKGTQSEGKTLGISVAIIYTGLYAYWAAFPLWNTVYIYGYPLLAIPPSPGPFYSSRYSYQWWFVWMLASNIAPPLLFLIAANFRKSTLASSAFYWLNVLVVIASTASLLCFVYVWIFDCNYGWSSNSICNDYRYCCEQFANAPSICPNTTPCPPGNVRLYPNPDFIQHLIFALIFTLLASVMSWIYYRMRKYKVIT